MTSAPTAGPRARANLAILWLALCASSSAFANQALANRAGCLGCHAVATKLVGPAYQEVAQRYKGDPAALAMLTQRIRQGGAGKWGDTAMPAQPALSAVDAGKLAKWILSGPR